MGKHRWTEGGAMKEEGLITPGGQPTLAEQVVEEPETEMESWWARVMRRIRRPWWRCGRRAEVESGTQRLEVKARDSPATVMIETVRPMGLAPYWWWAEGHSGVGGRSGRVGGHFWPSGLLPTHTKFRFPAREAWLTGLHSRTESLSEQDVETGALSGLGGGTGAFSGLNSGAGALSGLDVEMGALSGLDGGTGALSGPNSGTGALSGMDRETGGLPGLEWGTYICYVPRGDGALCCVVLLSFSFSTIIS